MGRRQRKPRKHEQCNTIVVGGWTAHVLGEKAPLGNLGDFGDLSADEVVLETLLALLRGGLGLASPTCHGRSANFARSLSAFLNQC